MSEGNKSDKSDKHRLKYCIPASLHKLRIRLIFHQGLCAEHFQDNHKKMTAFYLCECIDTCIYNGLQTRN